MTIENYFESQEFIESLKPLAKYLEQEPEHGYILIEYIISTAIKYSVLFRNGNLLTTAGLSEFLLKVTNKVAAANLKRCSEISSNYQLQKEINHLFVKELLEKAYLTEKELDNPQYKEALCSYIIKNLKGQDYMYHAFNSTLLDSIKKHGINPQAKFTNQQEINTIDAIFKKYNISMIFGWQKLNCESKVSYSMNPSVSYYYGINSPEWFAQFTGQGFAFNPSTEYDKSAFVTGNYDHAKQNLLKLMQKNNFTEQDQDIVINFFDKQWNIYANQTPMLAIIPTPMESNSIDWLNILLQDESLSSSVYEMMEFCLLDPRTDCHTEQMIDTSQAIFIQLPKYHELVKRITEETEILPDELSPIPDIIYNKPKR